MARKLSFNDFIGRLLIESFPKGYFITHTFENLSDSQVSRLHGNFLKFFLRCRHFLSILNDGIFTDLMLSQPSSMTLPMREFKIILKKTIKEYRSKHINRQMKVRFG